MIFCFRAAGKETLPQSRLFCQALRVFTPVYDERHRRIGGSDWPEPVTLRSRSTQPRQYYLVHSVRRLVGLLGTYALVKVLKRILLGLEPYEISLTLFEITPAMLQSIKEGVIAVMIAV